MDISISVVIPHFRRADVVREALDSVFAQTRQPDEVIVVDDHSGDGSPDVIRAHDPRVRVIELPRNGGVSGARNAGARAATGTHIAFLDSDDLWAPTKLEEQVAYLADRPGLDGVHTGCVSFWPDGREELYLHKPAILTTRDLVQSSHVVFPSMLMRRDVFLAAGGFDERIRQTEDYEFSMRLVSAGYLFGFLPHPLTRVRRGRSDKISLNWIGYLRGHLTVVWRHAAVYRQHDGWLGPFRHSAKYLVKAGTKRGGLLGRLVSAVGRPLWPAQPAPGLESLPRAHSSAG